MMADADWPAAVAKAQSLTVAGHRAIGCGGTVVGRFSISNDIKPFSQSEWARVPIW